MRRQARVRKVRPLRPRLQGRAQGLCLPVPGRHHAPQARARRHQEGSQGEAPPCHARDRIEKVFEIAKQGSKALPACVQTEETFRGHSLMCLVATAATRMMSDVLASRRTSPAVESMPETPRERHATGYGGRLITTEPVRRMSEAHGAFGIRCPDAIRLPVVG